MARVAITIETADRFDGGKQATFVAFDQPNGMEYDNATGDVVPIFINNGAAERTVTVTSVDGVDTDLAVADRPLAIPNDGYPVFGGKYAGSYYNQTGNLVYLDIDVGTSVEVACVRFLS